MDLIIEGDPAQLEWLRCTIDRELGAEVELEAVPLQDTEELSEPVIVALVIALGPTVVSSISELLQRRYQHQEEMERLRAQLRENELEQEGRIEELRLRLAQENGGDQRISEQELADLQL